jgi:hypothetical protein
MLVPLRDVTSALATRTRVGHHARNRPPATVAVTRFPFRSTSVTAETPAPTCPPMNEKRCSASLAVRARVWLEPPSSSRTCPAGSARGLAPAPPPPRNDAPDDALARHHAVACCFDDSRNTSVKGPRVLVSSACHAPGSDAPDTSPCKRCISEWHASAAAAVCPRAGAVGGGAISPAPP